MLIVTILIHEHEEKKIAFQASPQKFGGVVTPAEANAWLVAEHNMMEGMRREGGFEPVEEPKEQPAASEPEKRIIGSD